MPRAGERSGESSGEKEARLGSQLGVAGVSTCTYAWHGYAWHFVAQGKRSAKALEALEAGGRVRLLSAMICQRVPW